MPIKPPLTRDTWPQAITKIRRLLTAGAGSGTDADLLDGEEGTFYRNATNINAGTLADARLSSNVPLKNAAATISGLYNYTTRPTVSGNAVYHKGDGLQQQVVTIADDAAATITLPANCGTSFILAIAAAETNTQGALIWVSTSLNTVRILAQFSTVWESADGTVLTGTTGTSGVTTVSAASGALYVENRKGASRDYSLSFLANQ